MITRGSSQSREIDLVFVWCKVLVEIKHNNSKNCCRKRSEVSQGKIVRWEMRTSKSLTTINKASSQIFVANRAKMVDTPQPVPTWYHGMSHWGAHGQECSKNGGRPLYASTLASFLCREHIALNLTCRFSIECPFKYIYVGRSKQSLPVHHMLNCSLDMQTGQNEC